jgi:hypothetical protein
MADIRAACCSAVPAKEREVSKRCAGEVGGWLSEPELEPAAAEEDEDAPAEEEEEFEAAASPEEEKRAGLERSKPDEGRSSRDAA